MQYKRWLGEWLELYVKPTVKGRTYKKYRQQIERYIIPALGEHSINDLTSIMLQGFVANLAKYGLSANTINGIICLLKSSLSKAMRLGTANKNPCDGIERPKIREKNIECFSQEEQTKIEGFVLKNQDKNERLFGIIFSLYTGIRLGELLALKWADLDLAKGEVSINKTCADFWQDGEYVKLLDEPKTAHSRRVIPLPKQLLPQLKKMKRRRKNEYFIGGRSGHGVGVRSYQRTFSTILNKLKIPHRGFHSLRHTFATRALECGMDVKTLSEILGHKNSTITLNRYAHSLWEYKLEMMNKLGKMCCYESKKRLNPAVKNVHRIAYSMYINCRLSHKKA